MKVMLYWVYRRRFLYMESPIERRVDRVRHILRHECPNPYDIYIIHIYIHMIQEHMHMYAYDMYI